MKNEKIEMSSLSISELNQYAIAADNICRLMGTNASINMCNEIGELNYDNASLMELNTFIQIKDIINNEIKKRLKEILK